MIADHDIARWRLRSRILVRPHAPTVIDAVGTLLVVQAENPNQSAWAVASRTLHPSQSDMRAAFEGRATDQDTRAATDMALLRAEDAGWLLDLTGPRVRRITPSNCTTCMGSAIVSSTGHLRRARDPDGASRPHA